MKIQDCSPLEARWVFKSRPFKHGGYCIAILIPILGILWFCLNPLVGFENAFPIAFGIASLVALGIFCFYESRLIVVECPNCGRDIETNVPWECGYKGCKNENTVQFPFIHECGHCHHIPKAYICHHCKKYIFLSVDRQMDHPAKYLSKPGVPEVKTVTIVKDVIGDKIATQREAVRDLEHELKIATIRKDIEIVSNKPVKPSERTMRDEIRKQMVTLYSRNMSREDVAEEMKELIRKQYGHDLFECDKRLAMIDQIMLELL
jgi:hypothetical protein